MTFRLTIVRDQHNIMCICKEQHHDFADLLFTRSIIGFMELALYPSALATVGPCAQILRSHAVFLWRPLASAGSFIFYRASSGFVAEMGARRGASRRTRQ